MESGSGYPSGHLVWSGWSDHVMDILILSDSETCLPAFVVMRPRRYIRNDGGGKVLAGIVAGTTTTANHVC